MKNQKHIPVLASEVTEVLSLKSGQTFLDVTAGYGGHTSLLLKEVGKAGYGYLLDRDENAIAYLIETFKNVDNLSIICMNFANITAKMFDVKFNAIIADIGVSSPQLDVAERGFSFMHDGPLDMRMNNTQKITAAGIVNNYSSEELQVLFSEYGQERFSKTIARAIVQKRKQKKFTTTGELSELIENTVGRRGKLHPATKVFQALRIEVNDEINALKHFLEVAPNMLDIGGRLAIISFHSIEDRLVKQTFNKLVSAEYDTFGQITQDAKYKKVTKKPIMGSILDKQNPRARSAKLRVLEKIK